MILQVRDRDTLTSVAARFDTTPSELTKLNRLATQFIFSGQNLLVPDKRKGGHFIINYTIINLLYDSLLGMGH